MLIFFVALFSLIIGYFTYGVFIERILKINPHRKTPAIACADGVDYVALPPYKIFLIQFLNIAGLGPVFGAILGALYGPVCLLWIVLGSIFAGAVHDFLSGVISLRFKGKTLVFLTEIFFGKKCRSVFLILLTLMLTLVGSIFAQTPARMLADMTPNHLNFLFWLAVVFIYYFLATLLPVDKIIGRFYPLFGACLIISSVLLLFVLLTNGTTLYPDLITVNQHPKSLPIFPLMFITIACGAISGFHATQSPLMARCVSNEKYARPIFYGAMILEGFIALIWATLGISFYNGTGGLANALGESGNAGAVVREISMSFLGSFGGFLTILSVIFLTITSGDTALRSARLFCADFLKMDQKNLMKRLVLSLLVLGLAISMSFINLSTIWLYFGWVNQILATFMLWIGALFLRRKGWNYWVALLPAIFMTFVCATYLGYAKILFAQDIEIARIIGMAITLMATAIFFLKRK